MPKGETQSQNDNLMLPTNPERAIQEMMVRIDELRAVYMEETDALEKSDTARFLKLQDTKLESARRYQLGIEEILSRKDEMQRIDPMLKTRLQKMQADFSGLAHSNMTALKRMQRTMERLGGTVRNAAKDAVNKQRSYSYGESGILKSNEKRVVSTGISETA